jgi:hypothetical protein
VRYGGRSFADPPASCAFAGFTGGAPRHGLPGSFAMTPQSHVLINAPIKPGARADLEKLLASMNQPAYPGMADPKNALIPFGAFGALHIARFVIVDDNTLKDFALANLPVPDYPITLAFMANCDGNGNRFLADMLDNATAAAGLRKIFGHCAGFDEATDLRAWIRQYTIEPVASYVNWIGRTVLQVHKEAELRGALRKELTQYVKEHPDAGDDVRGVRDHLVKFGRENPDLIPVAAPTPIGWWLCNWLHFAIIPVLLAVPWLFAIDDLIRFPWLLVFIVAPFALLAIVVFIWLACVATATFALLVALGLMLVPFFILYPLWLIPLLAIVIVFLVVLRWHEKNEPVIIPKLTAEHDTRLAYLEDHDVSNQFSVVGSIQPNAFRRMLIVILFWLTDYGARHVYNRGFLTRIQTIHLAHWIFINDKRRLLFFTAYDGSRHAYMDDFINKVGWGLNILFSSGFGWPRTNWLIQDGCKNELPFKDANRRHQIATQVWYKAYPGLTAFDLARNTRIRKGLQRRWMREAKIRAWLRDL